MSTPRPIRNFTSTLIQNPVLLNQADVSQELGLALRQPSASSGTKRKQPMVGTPLPEKSSKLMRPASHGSAGVHASSPSIQTMTPVVRASPEPHGPANPARLEHVDSDGGSIDVRLARLRWTAASTKVSRLRFSKDPRGADDAAKLGQLVDEEREAGLRYHNLKWGAPPTKPEVSFNAAQKAYKYAQQKIASALRSRDMTEEELLQLQRTVSLDEAERSFMAARLYPANAMADIASRKKMTDEVQRSKRRRQEARSRGTTGSMPSTSPATLHTR